MKHLGDITKINGAEIPPVDVITGGSPCQDLSVAGKRAGLDGERSGLFMEQIRIIRRLTPMECERLQGFPDGWTDIGEWTDSKGKKRDTSDTARYKALGNSIALPYWKVLARRIAAQYDRDITMGSLFSGIGGFELAFQHTGATPVWASEIEEFCIAVTKKHFPENEK